MRIDAFLDAIDAAFRSPAFCACGRDLSVAVHDDAAWLECVAFASPTAMPGSVAMFVRGMLHDRRFIVDAPAPAAVMS